MIYIQDKINNSAVVAKSVPNEALNNNVIFILTIIVLFTFVIVLWHQLIYKSKLKNKKVKQVINEPKLEDKDSLNNTPTDCIIESKDEKVVHIGKDTKEQLLKDKKESDKPFKKTEKKDTSKKSAKQGKKKNHPCENELIAETIISKNKGKSRKIKQIGYKPTDLFDQGPIFQYPLILMPADRAKIKAPRKGCSNKKGYKEDVFFEFLKSYFGKAFQIFNDQHIPTKNGNHPYEPDFVIINEKGNKNIFIDIEIDEPYEAFSRTPTHEVGSDTIRNTFFTNRGWIVIRFSEIQIHEDPRECCYKIAQVIESIDPDYEIPFNYSLYGELSPRENWTSIKAKKWAKGFYREKYLGIDSFGTRPNVQFEYDITVSAEDDLLESQINDDLVIPIYQEPEGMLNENRNERDKRLTFDSNEHRYFIDGNPDTISASQLITKFFPEFDSAYWSERKAVERGITPEEILEEWEAKRKNSADLGTALHKEIENYYNGFTYNEQLPEFQHFLKFKNKYSTMIPYRSEWRIFDEEHLIAGTVDMVYKKENDELYMFDWKRSEKVVDKNGNINLTNFDYASGDLSHLSDNSYNRYAIQQNIYKYILEKRYNKKISSMNLLILHPNFDSFHLVKLPDLTKEVEYIFENSKHYR